MDKQAKLLAGVIIALAGVSAAVGVGVYMFGGDRQEITPEPRQEVAPPPVQPSDPQAFAAPSDPDAEYEAFMLWLEEEAAKAEEAESKPAPQIAAPAPEIPHEMPAPLIEEMPQLFDFRPPTGGRMPRWQSIWSDINLTQEEQSRLRAGVGLLMARWASMPPEMQVAERARLEQMRFQWEAMNDEDRAATSQRLRARFEDWRASGQIELPEITLD